MSNERYNIEKHAAIGQPSFPLYSGVSFFFSSTKREGGGEKQSRHAQRIEEKERFARKAVKERKRERKKEVKR